MSTGRPCLYHRHHDPRRRRRTISSSPSATPRSCTRRCPTNPPSSTLLDATSCSACLAACREKARPFLVKINQPYPKVIFHYSKTKNHRRTSHSFEEARLQFRQISRGLARTTAHTNHLQQQSFFFFWKILGPTSTIRDSVWQPASPSRSQALPARALNVRNFHPLIFFICLGAHSRGA